MTDLISTEAGNAPAMIKIQTVVVYGGADGRIVHKHEVITLPGARLPVTIKWPRTRWSMPGGTATGPKGWPRSRSRPPRSSATRAIASIPRLAVSSRSPPRPDSSKAERAGRDALPSTRPRASSLSMPYSAGEGVRGAKHAALGDDGVDQLRGRDVEGRVVHRATPPARSGGRPPGAARRRAAPRSRWRPPSAPMHRRWRRARPRRRECRGAAPGRPARTCRSCSRCRRWRRCGQRR